MLLVEHQIDVERRLEGRSRHGQHSIRQVSGVIEVHHLIRQVRVPLVGEDDQETRDDDGPGGCSQREPVDASSLPV